jgi:hypothetical protein
MEKKFNVRSILTSHRFCRKIWAKGVSPSVVVLSEVLDRYEQDEVVPYFMPSRFWVGHDHNLTSSYQEKALTMKSLFNGT